jgi:hypothetical protein
VRPHSLEYRLLFAGVFAVMLVAALFETLLPQRWMQQNQERKGSIIHRASESAQTCVAYAFMG